jgi:hypothetical protein
MKLQGDSNIRLKMTDMNAVDGPRSRINFTYRKVILQWNYVIMLAKEDSINSTRQIKITMKLTRLNDHVTEGNHCLTSEISYKNRYQKHRIDSALYAVVLGFESMSRSRQSSLTNFTVICSVQTKAPIIIRP